eukprot:76818_1
MAHSSSTIQCPSCGTKYAGRHQLATGLQGKYCGNCNTKIFSHLFHQTSQSAASAITSSQTMKPGKKGMAGPGIYFATNPYATDRKAQQHGAMLRADVYLGNELTVNKNGNSSLNGRKVANKGYDSVHIPRNGGFWGAEHVVYDTKQVSNIKPWQTL